MKTLLLRLESPLLAFGGVAVDAHGYTDDWPSASLLTGLLGNALGYRRTDVDKLQALQEQLDFAVRIDRPGHRLTDYQTAELAKADVGWTTYGQTEGRKGDSYGGQHQRYREFHADAAVTVAIQLRQPDFRPDVDSLATALDRPARPLFIGRKPCLPSARLLLGVVEVPSLFDALMLAPLAEDARPPLRCFSLTDDAEAEGCRRVCGLRNWRSGVHEGSQLWLEQSWSPAT